jgi:acetyl esterase/lipase
MSDPEIAALRALIARHPRAADIAQRRRDMDERGRQFPIPPEVAIEKATVGGVKAEWNIPPDSEPGSAIIYVHGGGYVIGSLDSHRHLTAEIARVAQTRVLALDYRLAPEHPFPAPVEDTLAAYRELLTSGMAAQRIGIAGDSAGGGLVVGAMLAIKEAGLPLPGAGWCISPWTDMEIRGASFEDLAAVDPTVQRAGIEDMARQYLAGADPRSPHASPIHGDLRGLPPLLIQVGAAETLLDDALQLARVAGMADVVVDLQIWPEMIHVWHLFYPRLNAGRRAIASGGSFLRSTLKGS